MIVSIIILIVAGFLNGESENILRYQLNKNWRKPMFPSWAWYVNSNWKYENAIVQFLMRYPFSFLKDGFHFLKTLSIVLLIIGLHLLGVDLWLAILITYTIFGIGFNIGYHT